MSKVSAKTRRESRELNKNHDGPQSLTVGGSGWPPTLCHSPENCTELLR